MNALLQKPPLLVILGPTGSGKSDLAIKLAKKFNGEVVNADSRQVYKGMVIGTGSPFPKTQGIPHHLFHFVQPDEEFTVAHYKEAALKTITNIHRRGKLPILVGGTGLYIKAVVENLDIPHVPPNKKLREKFEMELTSPNPLLRKERTKKILQKYYQKLLKLDPHTTVDSHNPRRIIRALEVCMATKKPWSTLQQKKEPLFNVLQLGIDIPRKELYARIDERVEKMFRSGLIEETKKLIKKYPLTLPALSGIGYGEVGEWLRTSPHPLLVKERGHTILPLLYKERLGEVMSRIQFRTHAYARRQMTWFKKTEGVKWINIAITRIM